MKFKRYKDAEKTPYGPRVTFETVAARQKHDPRAKVDFADTFDEATLRQEIAILREQRDTAFSHELPRFNEQIEELQKGLHAIFDLENPMQPSKPQSGPSTRTIKPRGWGVPA